MANGDFSTDNISAFRSNTGTIISYDSTNKRLSIGSTGMTAVGFYGLDFGTPTDHLFYASYEVYMSEDRTYSVRANDGHKAINKGRNIISYIQSRSIGNFYHFIYGMNKGEKYYIDNITFIDLTQSFGAGKEPSKEEMDRLINYLGYFNESKTVSIGRFI